MKIIELFEDTITEDNIIELIKRDCKPWLGKAKELVYRGMQKKVDAPFKQEVRADRQPRNTDGELHKAMDDWFNDNFGFRARSAAVFVTGDFDDAKSYGQAYAIFPIGDFKFVWSPNVGDLYMSMHNETPGRVPLKLERFKFQDDELEKAISSGFEIMIKCKDYYAVPVISIKEAKFVWDQLK